MDAIEDLSISEAAELEGPKVLGIDDSDELFQAHFSDAPIALELDKVYGAAGLAIPATLKLYDRFKIWMVPHHFGLIRKRGAAEPVSVSIRVRYITEGGTCSIISMFPSSEYVTLGGVSANVITKAEIDASKLFKAATDVDPTGSFVPAQDRTSSGTPFQIPGLGFDASAAVSAKLNVTANVITPVISAVGLDGTTCAWRFDRHQLSLEGRDIKTWALIAVSKFEERIRYNVVHSYKTRTCWFPTTKKGKERLVTCIPA